jgi:hypothetical protein
MDDSHIRQEINKYKKFKKVDGATYRKVNQFLRKRTYITAREWALARLCTDFRTSGGAEMTFIGKNLPELVPFMEDTYTPQAVNQARNSFKKKVRKASATFFYGAMCGFFTTDELDDLLFEASEVARFLLEVEGTTLDIDEEIDIEDRITKVMRSVGEAAKTILKSRADEGDSNDQALISSSQKSTQGNNLVLEKGQGQENTSENKTPEVNDYAGAVRVFGDKTTEIYPAVDKKIALDGSITVSFVSGEKPDTHDQATASDTIAGERKSNPRIKRENNGTQYP